MYWEPKLICPHCTHELAEHPDHPMCEWRQVDCDCCGEPFKFMTESVVQYTTMSPALEAVRQKNAEALRRMLGGNP